MGAVRAAVTCMARRACLRRAMAVLAVLCALAGVLAMAATAAGPRYGVAEDATKFADDGGGPVYRDILEAGMTVNRWTAIWDPAAETREFPFIDRALAAKPSRVEIVLSLYPDPSKLAVDASGLKVAPDPAAFCAWAGRMAGRYKGRIDRFIVLNEPNLATFWPRTNRAATIAATLAACYDTIKAANPAAEVIGLGLSARAPSSASSAPITLISEIGAAYKASGRAAPLFDSIAVHPYPSQDRSIKVTQGPADPAASYAGTPSFYGIATLKRVKDAVASAFGGTGQPTFAGGLRLVIDEYGYQVEMTGDPRYTGAETSSTVPDQATQAAYLATAMGKYAACDADISDVLLFHMVDEKDLGSGDGGGGWQSGLEEVDRTRRQAFGAVREAIAAGCTAAPAPATTTAPGTTTPAAPVLPARPRVYGGQPCTVFGTERDDRLSTLRLTRTAICGFGGDDTIAAPPAGGTVLAGIGDDVVTACDGRRDRIDGGPGVDTAYVEPGDTVTRVEHVHPCPRGAKR